MTTIKLRRGTAAQWASAATVLAAGEPGVETDTGVYKVGDGSTAWASLNPVLNATFAGKELGYAESASGVATTSNAGTLVTGTAVTVTIGSHPVRVMWGGLCESTTAAANGYLELWEAGVRTGRVGFNTPGTGKFQQTTGSRRRAPAAGSITYDVRLVSADNTSTVTVIAGATFPCWISVTEV